MKKTTLLLLSFVLAACAHADTITWTGNAGTSDWSTPGNWNPSSVPAAADDVIIAGTSVTKNGDLIVSSLTLTGGATVTASGELKSTADAPYPVYTGGRVSCSLVALLSGPITLSDAEIANASTAHRNGIYGGGNPVTYLNFTDGASRAAKYTYATSWNPDSNNTYANFFQGDNAYIRYNGIAIDRETFDDNFVNTDNGDGTSTISMRSAVSWVLSAPTAANVTASSATLSTTLRKIGEGTGTVVFSHGTSAAAVDLANGESLGAASVEGASFSKSLTGLTADTLYYYAFGVVTGNVVVAQTEIKTFFASDYSAIFLGEAGDGLAATAGNWSSGSVPTDSDTILIKADCTWLPGNLNLVNWNVTVDGATLTVNGEVNQTAARAIRNGALSASVFVGSGNAIEVRGSDITATTTDRWNAVPRGFYAAAPFFNFHSGAACSYTYTYDPAGAPPDAAAEFAALFTQGRILVDGTVLTDASRVEITTNTTDHTMTATLLASAVTASFEDVASATVNGLAATLSATVEVGGTLPLYVLVGTDPANLAATLVAAEAADATTYTFATNGIEGSLTYYQFRLGEGDGAIYDSLAPQSFFSTANGNVWLGAVSSLASVPANWSKGAVPVPADAVYVVKEKAQHDLDWDLSGAAVASWKQLGDASVTFHGTPSNALSVAGNVVLEGGTWTHAGPAAEPTTMINVSVGGDLVVGASASIQAGTGTGGGESFRSRGYARANGPGYLRGAGGSFAGDGGHPPIETAFVSYGSILEPLSWGSGAWGDSELYAGGGIVKLVVGGTLTVDGLICSRGFGWPLDADETIGGSGSGGTVNLTAGALAGSGTIDANGGNNGLYGPGSGGRVKIALTGAGEDFEDFTGTIEALGGSMQNADQAGMNDLSPAAAGTVCLSTAGADPVVKVHNEFRYGNAVAPWRVAIDPGAVPSGTHVPSMQDATDVLSRVHWELSGHGALRVTKDVRTYALTLADDDGSQCVYTDGHTMTVKELTIDGASQHAGRYTASDLPGIVVGAGAVVVDQMPLLILFR